MSDVIPVHELNPLNNLATELELIERANNVPRTSIQRKRQTLRMCEMAGCNMNVIGDAP